MRRLILFALLLFAIGAAAQNHSATLSWVALPDTPTSNVYRAPGACPSTGSPTGQVKLNLTPVAATTYKDSTVAGANTYCYTVRATLNGVESVDSNTAQAVIPLAPSSGLTVVA